jgi:threonine/homoserine/homoserine lactone efflux protein
LISEIITSFLSGALFGVSAGLTPGPLLTLAISHTLRYGVKDGYKIACAPLMTDLPIIAMSFLLLSKLSQINTALVLISIAGGLFVLYLAYESWSVYLPQMASLDQDPKSIRRGIIVNLLNPHPYLFWFSVGVPYMLQGFAKSSVVAMAFAVSFYIFIIGSKAMLVYLVGKSKKIISNRLYINIMRILGVLLFVFAMLLFYEAYALWTQ